MRDATAPILVPSARPGGPARWALPLLGGGGVLIAAIVLVGPTPVIAGVPVRAAVLVLVALVAAIAILPDHAILMGLALWLPFQNIAAALLLTWGVGNAAAFLATIAKEVVILVAFAVLLMRGRARRLRTAGWPVLAFLALCTLFVVRVPLLRAVGVETVLGGSLAPTLYGLRLVVLPMALYLVGLMVATTPEELRRVVQIVVVSALLSVLTSLYVHWAVEPAELRAWQRAIYSLKGLDTYSRLWFTNLYASFSLGPFAFRRLAGTYMEPGTLGYATMFVLLLVGALARARRSPVLRHPLVWFPGLVLLSGAVLLSLTRGAFLGLLCGAGVIALYEPRVRVALLVAAPIMLGLIGLSQTTITILSSTVTLADPSAAGHYRALASGIEALFTHPLGLGLGQGGYVGANLLIGRTFTGAVESFYLSLGSQVGVIGIVLYLFFLRRIVRALRRGLAAVEETGFLRAVTLAVLAGLVAYHVPAIVTESALAFLSSGVFWVLAGAVVGLLEAGVGPTAAERRDRSGAPPLHEDTSVSGRGAA